MQLGSKKDRFGFQLCLVYLESSTRPEDMNKTADTSRSLNMAVVRSWETRSQNNKFLIS